MPRLVTPRSPLRTAAAALLAAALVVQPRALLAQAQEWWDLYDAAVKVIANEKASESEVESARRKLVQAEKAKGAEGNFATYNESVRIDYLPYFYLGWANMRLKRYDEASKNFKKSEDLGFIKKGAPAALRTKFDNFKTLATQLKPAGDALAAAKSSPLAGQCAASASSPSGPKIKDAISKIEAMLANPTDAGALKGLVDSLQGSVADCVKEVKGAQIARLAADLQAARDDVVLEGIADLLAPETQRELDAALAAGKQAEGAGDEEGLKAATERLKGLAPKVARDVDARLGALAGEAERLVRGNERALDEQNQIGSRLAGLAASARGSKAAGRKGKDLAAVAKVAADLKSLVGTAGSALAPTLAAKRNALDAAKRDHDAWASTHACEIDAVGARGAADAAVKEAAAARQGESADALDAAAGKLAAVRPDVEAKMKDALPRIEEEAKGALESAASIIANVPDASQKTRGESLKSGIEQALARKDVCTIDGAIGDLNKWVAVVAPRMKADRERAVARHQPALEEGQRLLSGFGGILKAETVAALKAPVDRLAGLLKNSYDVAAMDKAGQEVRDAAGKANGEVRGQMQEGIRALRAMKSDAGWAEVSAARRQWLDQNLAAVERAVQEMSSPDLLARFAREYPRARLEMALASSFAALYGANDAARAAKTLEDLGPGFKAGSAAVNYALAYFYWWQGKAASESEREALVAKAREAFDAGKALRVDVAGLGASLFAPAFVEEMSRR